MENVRFVLQRQHWDVITDDECKMVLRKMRPIIESFLQGRLVADSMAEDGIIEEQHFQAMVDREQVNKALVGLVEDKGKAVLTSFMDALLKTEQPRLYDILLGELQRSAAAVFPCLAQPARLPEAIMNSPHGDTGRTAVLPGKLQLPESTTGGLQLMLANKSALQLYLTTDDQHLVVCPVCERVMTDPVLLPCLHSCCRSCIDCGDTNPLAAGDRPSAPNYREHMSTDAVISVDSIPLQIADAERNWPAGSERRASRSQLHSCPVCGESMPIGDSLSNRLVTMRVALLTERAAGITCRRCHERGYDDVEGVVRCMNCSTFMCQSCATDHDSFLKNHTVISCQLYFDGCEEALTGGEGERASQSGIALRSIIRPPALTCIVHGNLMDMYCSDCEMLICSEYLKRKCLPDRHSMLLPLEVTAERMRTEIQTLANDLWPLELQDGVGLSVLSSSATSGSDALIIALRQLQRSLVDPLDFGKRALLEAVEHVYDTARELVQQYCDSLERQARRAEARVGRAVAYCRQLSRMGDDATIAEQHGTVVACLRRLSSSDYGTDNSHIDDLSAQAICKDYLVIERRQLTDGYLSLLSELIGQPKAATFDRPLPLHSVLDMALDPSALVRLKEDDEKVKVEETGHSEEAQKAITAGDGQPVPSPTVDTADDEAGRMEEPSGLSEEFDSNSVQQWQKRYALAEDLINELRVQLQQAEEEAVRLKSELQSRQATIRELDHKLLDLREKKSLVDCELETLRSDQGKVTGIGQSRAEPPSLSGASTASRSNPAMHVGSGNVPLDTQAAPSAVHATGGWSWPLQHAAAGGFVQVGSRPYTVPPRTSPALRGHGFLATGLQQPTHHHLHSPPPSYTVAVQGQAASTSISAGYAPASRYETVEAGDAGQYQSLPLMTSVRVRSRLPSSSEACGQQVLAIDRSCYGKQQEIWWRNADGESDVGLALTLHWMERLDVKCFDVAVTHDGILAVATGKGVSLFDSMGRGRRELLQVGDYHAYRCVASVPDGAGAELGRSARSGSSAKFVAGNKSAKVLELLVLSGTWPAVRFDIAGVLLEGHLPWCVAVDRQGRTAAVSSGRLLRTVPLDFSGNNITFKIGYTVSALAYGSLALIVGSSEKQDGHYALEARDASNIDHQLWKLRFNEAIGGLLCERDSHCYVLLARSRALRMVSAADGTQLADVNLGCQLPPLAIDANDRLMVFLLGDSIVAQFTMHDVQRHAEKC